MSDIATYKAPNLHPQIQAPSPEDLVSGQGGVDFSSVDQPAPQPRAPMGPVKRRLMNFLEGFGDGAAKAVGLPTEQERQLNEQQIHLNQFKLETEQLDSQLSRDYKKAQTRNLDNQNEQVPWQNADGSVVNVLRKDYAKLLAGREKAAVDAQSREDKQQFTAQQNALNRNLRERLFENSERGKNSRAAAMRNGILRPLTDASGNIVALLNNRTGETSAFSGKDLRTQGLPGQELTRRGMLQGMIEDTDLLETLGEANRDSIGAFAGRTEAFKQSWLGSDEDKTTMFRLSDNLKDQLLRARSGAQINEQEFQRLSKLVPDPRTPAETFFARLKSFKADIRRLGLNTAASKNAGTGSSVKPTHKFNPATGEIEKLP